MVSGLSTKVWRSAQVLMWIGLLGVVLAVGRIFIDPILFTISGASISYRWGPAAIKTILLLGLYGFSLFLSYEWKVRPKTVGLLVLSSARNVSSSLIQIPDRNYCAI